jgi:hypothetical protein
MSWKDWDGDGAMTFAEARLDIVILACAISAGIHGALVGDHFREGAGAGTGFLVATVLLAGAAFALTRRPSHLVYVAAAAILIGLIGAYGLAITTGVPVLHPDVEAVDGLAVLTKAVEAIGALAAASLLPRPSFAPFTQPKGTPT